jgi:hypothetical protein
MVCSDSLLHSLRSLYLAGVRINLPKNRGFWGLNHFHQVSGLKNDNKQSAPPFTLTHHALTEGFNPGIATVVST